MSNDFRFYNSLTRKVDEFVPNEEGKVSMYTCGPTVYHYAHIGNIRTYIMQDVLVKALEYAKKHDLLIVFDIDYRPQVWKNKDEIAVYYSLCAKYAQIIIGSYEEFDLMDHLLKDGMDDKETAQYWFDQNAQIVIIKHGSEGSMAYEKDGRSYKIDIVPVNAVKSTGGGDSYSSAFMYGILSGRDVKDSLELATVSASLAVAAPCCSDAMVGIDVLEEKRKQAKENFGELVKEI